MTHVPWLFRMKLGVTLLLVGVASNLAAQTLIAFDYPGSSDTEPAGINSGGQVTGFYIDASNLSHGFLREIDGTLTTIDVPNSTNTTATGINSSGQITGSYSDASGGHAYVRERNGTLTTFDVPDSVEGFEQWHTEDSAGVAINRDGQVAGYYRQSTIPPGETRVQAFVRNSDGTFTTFGMGSGVDMRPTAINQAGQVVGTVDFYDPPGPDEAFRRDPNSTVSVFDDGSGITILKDINAGGRIVGWGHRLGSFLRQRNGTIVTYSVQNSVLTFPNAINANGQITGFYIDADNSLHGFLRERDGSIVTFDAPGSSYTYPTDVNPAGQITGHYQDANGVHGFLR